MKAILFTAALLSGSVAQAFAFRCDPNLIRAQAQQVSREARQFEQAIGNAPGYVTLLDEVSAVQNDLRALLRKAQQPGVPCPQLQEIFRREAQPSFRSLRRAYDPLDTQFPNPVVRRAWRQLLQAFQGLESAATTPVNPNPNPNPVDPCWGLGGNYTGICRVDGSSAASAIHFTVAAQGPACYAVNSPYFLPVQLAVGGGQATAVVQQIPGGVAINQTTLVVQGAGRFVMRGYNYAGKFWFTCTPN